MRRGSRSAPPGVGRAPRRRRGRTARRLRSSAPAALEPHPGVSAATRPTRSCGASQPSRPSPIVTDADPDLDLGARGVVRRDPADVRRPRSPCAQRRPAQGQRSAHPRHSDVVEELPRRGWPRPARRGSRPAPRPARRTTRSRGCWSARRAAAAAARDRPAAARPAWRGTARRPTASPPAGRRPPAEQEPGQPGADRVGVCSGRPARDVVEDREVVVEHVEPLGEQPGRHVQHASPGRGRHGPRGCAAAWSCPSRSGPTSATRSGPLRSRSTAVPVRRTRSGWSAPAGRAAPRWPGRSTRISRSSRSRASASSSRSRAASSRSSCTSRQAAAEFSAARFFAPDGDLGHAAGQLRGRGPARLRWASSRSASTRSVLWRRRSERAVVTACSAAACSAATWRRTPSSRRRTSAPAPSRRSPIRSTRSSSSRSWLTTSSVRAPALDTSYSRPARGVEVVGRLVEEQHVGRRSSSRASAELGDLAAGELAEPAVEDVGGQPEPGQLGGGAVLDVPVVADGVEVAPGRPTRPRRPACAQRPCRCRGNRRPAGRVEGQVLRQVADLAGDAQVSRRSGAARRRSGAAAWTCRRRWRRPGRTGRAPTSRSRPCEGGGAVGPGEAEAGRRR